MRIGSIPKDQRLRESIEYTWRVHKTCLDSIGSQIQEHTDGLNAELDRIATEFENPDEVAMHQENFINFHEEFYQGLNILPNSFFVTSYSVFEYQLIRMCERSQGINNFSAPIRDRPDLVNIKDYLRDVGVRFPFGGEDGSTTWTDVKRYNDIRNQIVHNDGLVTQNCHFFEYAVRQGVVDGIQDWCDVRTGLIDVSRGRFRLNLSRQFCEDAANIFEQCILKIIEVDPSS